MGLSLVNLVCGKASLLPLLVGVSIAVKGYHDHGNSCKRKHLIVMTHLVRYCHGRNQGSVQADNVVEKELRILTS